MMHSASQTLQLAPTTLQLENVLLQSTPGYLQPALASLQYASLQLVLWRRLQHLSSYKLWQF